MAITLSPRPAASNFSHSAEAIPTSVWNSMITLAPRWMRMSALESATCGSYSLSSTISSAPASAAAASNPALTSATNGNWLDRPA